MASSGSDDDSVDVSIWGCVLTGLAALAVLLWGLIRAPGRPSARMLALNRAALASAAARARGQPGQHAHEAEEAQARRNPFAPGAAGSAAEAEPDSGAFVIAPLSSSSASSSSSSSFDVDDDLLDPASLIIRDQKLRRQSRVFWLCVLGQGLVVALFLAALLADSWERARLDTYVATSPPDPHVRLVNLHVTFGLGGRRVGTAHLAADGTPVALNGTLWESGSYSRLCGRSSSQRGCALGAQAGVGTVVAYSMLGLAAGMALSIYLLMAPRCSSSSSSSPLTPESRAMFLSAAWRAALITTTCIVASPLVWIASFHWSMVRRLTPSGGGGGTGGGEDSSHVRLGPSWIVAIVAAFLALPMLWASRRALQLLHSEDDAWCLVTSRSILSPHRRMRSGSMEHHYRAPAMQLAEQEQERQRQVREFTIPAGGGRAGGGGAAASNNSASQPAAHPRPFDDPEVVDAGLAHEHHLLRPERVSVSPTAQRINVNVRPTTDIASPHMPQSDQQLREKRLLDEALEEL